MKNYNHSTERQPSKEYVLQNLSMAFNRMLFNLLNSVNHFDKYHGGYDDNLENAGHKFGRYLWDLRQHFRDQGYHHKGTFLDPISAFALFCHTCHECDFKPLMDTLMNLSMAINNASRLNKDRLRGAGVTPEKIEDIWALYNAINLLRRGFDENYCQGMFFQPKEPPTDLVTPIEAMEPIDKQ